VRATNVILEIFSLNSLSSGHVCKSYVPTPHRELTIGTSPQHMQLLTGTALQHANEKELHARIEANMRHFEVLTAGTTGSSIHSINHRYTYSFWCAMFL
jgi:hypothetical protein